MMGRTVRRMLIPILLFALFAGFLPIRSKAVVSRTWDEVTSIVNEYYNTVTSNGSKDAYWNAGIRSGGTSKLKSQVNSGDYLTAITRKSCGLTKETHTHANGCSSNLFAGVGSVDNSGKISASAADAQCSGFAAYMEYVIFRSTSLSDFTVYGASGGKKLPSDYTVKPGDQVRYSGHSYVIYKVSGDTAYIIECNNPSGSCRINKGTKSVKTIKGYSYNGSTTFYISSPAVMTYQVSYDANGGTGAPASQTKTHGTALTLSNMKPTRADASAGSFTVTLNANGGSVSTTSLTAVRTTKYTFKNWNTKSDGSGTSYNAGASYTANAAATLYAQWNSSVSTAAVTLPTPTRDGYTFKGWGTSANATSGMSGSYTPTGNVTLYAVWEQSATPPQNLFTDVSNPSEYYYDAVYWARDNGITTGRTPTTFDPYAPCTRGQIVTFLWRMMGEPAPASGSNPFTDVKPGDYFYNAVLWAYSRGITTGKTKTTFQPYSPCTREQSVTFLWRAAGKPGTGGSNPFGDVKAGTYYYDAVRWAVANGITTGRTGTVFGVGQTCTRAQIVTFLYRYAN